MRIKKATRKLHKWLGIVICLFVMIAAGSAILLNHQDLWQPYFMQPVEQKFNPYQAKVIATDPFDSNHLVASDLHALFQSKDNGQTWQELKLYIPAEKVNNIVFDPQEEGSFYISLKEVGLFYTFDNGDIWEEINLPFDPVAGEYIDLMTIGNEQLTIKTKLGLYHYQISEDQWQSAHFQNVDADQVLRVKELIYELHTGKFFGTWGTTLYDFVSLGLIILSISGLMISFKKKRRRKRFTVNSNSVDSGQLTVDKELNSNLYSLPAIHKE